MECSVISNLIYLPWIHFFVAQKRIFFAKFILHSPGHHVVWRISWLYCTRCHAASVCCSETPHCANHDTDADADGATLCREDAAAAVWDVGFRTACSRHMAAGRRTAHECPHLGMQLFHHIFLIKPLLRSRCQKKQSRDNPQLHCDTKQHGHRENIL